ncbi:MAG: COX15/CtaA family protein [Phycisphaerae bacterium]
MNRPSPRDVGDILTLGFAITVAMWIVAYLSHLPGLGAPAPVVFALLMACLLGGGWIAGRASSRGVRAGWLAGGLCGLLNLLVLGGALRRADGTMLPWATLWAPASILIAAAVAGVGAALGGREANRNGVHGHTPAMEARNWPAAFCTVALVVTLALLSVGGVVTGYQAGLAVPDWPNSYGYGMFLYPLSRMTGGIYYEHAHRLFGSLLGLTTLTLCAYLLLAERRGYVKLLGVAALVLVIGQGVLGGLRVTGKLTLSQDARQLAPNLALAAVHGVTAQVFFSLLAALRVVLGRTWREFELDRNAGPRAAADLALGLASSVLVLSQITFGALLRHFDWGLHLHITLAVVVLIAVGAFAIRTSAAADDFPALRRIGRALTIALGAQFMLGFASLGVTSLDPSRESPGPLRVLVTTLHQSTGAVLLATTVATLVLRSRLRPRPVRSNAKSEFAGSASLGVGG